MGLRDPEWANRLGVEEVVSRLRELTNHPDQAVRVGALWAIGFAGHLPETARCSMLLDYDLATAPQTGEAWAEAMMPGTKIYTLYSAQDRAQLARKLRDVSGLGHWCIDLMAKLSQDAPEELLDSVIYRLTRPRTRGEDLDVVPSAGQGNPFHALPKATRKRGMIELGAVLQGENGIVAYDARRLFFLFAAGDPELVSQVRLCWVRSNDAKLILQAAESFGEEEPEALFTDQNFVVELIRAASAIGGELHDTVRSVLIGVTHNGLKRSTPGEPPPRDVEIRDRARQAAASMPEQSPERELYDQIAKNMDEWLRRLSEDERDRELGT
jgi:hypothetical protein